MTGDLAAERQPARPMWPGTGMDETFSRASFDATIDELVEVTIRGWAKSATIRRARRNSMLWTGLAIALLLLVVARPLWGERYGIAVMLPVSVLVGASVGYLVGPAYDSSTERRVRRGFVEWLHGSTTLRCEVEVRSSGLWIRQDNVEYLYRWTDVSSVEDTPISVDITVKNGLVVVRNRAFSSPTARADFLGHAQRLATAATAAT